MSAKKSLFGKIEKGEVYSFILDNGNGLSAEILNYGGILRRLVFNGTDVTLGRETLEDYLDNPEYLGAIVGRNVGGIPGAKIEVEGKIYKLSDSGNNSNGHGGIEGFDKKLWDAEICDGEEPSLSLYYVSCDGEEGFPGEVKVKVTYTLKKENILSLVYEAVSDKATLFNPTNHAYFNLNGHSSGSVAGNKMQLSCDFFIVNGVEENKKGEVYGVSGTPLDFSCEKEVGEALLSEHNEIICSGGIDHCFAVNGRGFRKVGKITGEKSGITMEIYTDKNGVGIYTGAYTRKNLQGKDGALYDNVHGICFETQNFSNGRGLSHLESGIIPAGEKLRSETQFRFMMQ